MKENRVEWIDSLKFIGIFYIYLGHFGKNAGLLYPFVFSFHVPLFFFISGLFYSKPKTISELTSLWVKCFKRIIIPYAAFSVISLVIISIYNQWDAGTTIENGVKAFYGIRNNIYAGSLWFLPCLFVVIIYHSIAMFILRSTIAVLILSIIIFLIASPHAIISNPSWFFNADSAMCYLVFYAIGSFTSPAIKKINLSNATLKKKTLYTSIFALSSAITAIAYFKDASYFYIGIQEINTRLIVSIMITCVLFVPNIFLAMFIKHAAITKLGESTLTLCGTEQVLKILMMSGVSMLGFKVNLTNPVNTILYTLLCLTVAYFTTVKIYDYTLKKIKAP